MRLNKVSEGVYYGEGAIVRVGPAELELLKREAAQNPRGRCRICAHASPESRLHEMLIVLARGTYIRPHRHLGRDESAHVIDGAADVVVFDEAGAIRDVLPMGLPSAGRLAFYRMTEPLFHTVCVRSEFLAFHEVTSGPFSRLDTEFAAWSPAEDNAAAAAAYAQELDRAVTAWQAEHAKSG